MRRVIVLSCRVSAVFMAARADGPAPSRRGLTRRCAIYARMRIADLRAERRPVRSSCRIQRRVRHAVRDRVNAARLPSHCVRRAAGMTNRPVPVAAPWMSAAGIAIAEPFVRRCSRSRSLNRGGRVATFAHRPRRGNRHETMVGRLRCPHDQSSKTGGVVSWIRPSSNRIDAAKTVGHPRVKSVHSKSNRHVKHAVVPKRTLAALRHSYLSGITIGSVDADPSRRTRSRSGPRTRSSDRSSFASAACSLPSGHECLAAAGGVASLPTIKSPGLSPPRSPGGSKAPPKHRSGVAGRGI